MSPVSSTPAEKWVTTEVAAEHIGKTPAYIYANARRLGIPHTKIGKQLRFRLSEVDAWLRAQADTAA